jgi:serine phosphatase RsbU (regulator of sigma subunit)
LNQHHWEEGEETRRKYVTAFLLRLDYRAGTLEFVNAGHNPAFLLTPNGAAPVLLKSSSTPLGMLPAREYEAEVHDFVVGSRLLVYTDGLTEVFHGEEEFGEKRLLSSFDGCPGISSAATLAHLWATIEAFAGNQPQDDDMTALAVSRTSTDTSEVARN